MFFVTGHTDHVHVTWDETFVPDRLFAHQTYETFLVPLLTFVFVLLHTSLENFLASITALCEIVIITVGAIN